MSKYIPTTQSHQYSCSSQSTSDQGPSFDVSALKNTGQENQTVSLKLTDECSMAIKQAIKCKRTIRMHVKKEEAILEIDDVDEGKTLVFKCALHNQTAIDFISFAPKKKLCCNVGSTTKHRLQVQATDKSFADMKEKTQKLVEAEQQRKAKDMPKSQKTNRNAHQDMQRKGPKNTSSNILAKMVATKRTHSPSPTAIIPKRNSPAPSLYVPKRLAVPMTRAPSKSPANIASSTPKMSSSPPSSTDRPASLSVENILQHSSSCSPEEFVEQHGSLTLEMKPSRDWSQEFGKVGSSEEARRFHTVFKNEYPEYRRYYEELMMVAEEFYGLKSSLEKTKDDEEIQRIEKLISDKYENLQDDKEFLHKRQRHHDLRTKLDFIKKAIECWNNSVM